MNQQDFLAYKIPILRKEGYNSAQAAAIAYSLFEKEGKKMQQGGEFNYNKTGDLNIGQRDLARINEGTGINFTPEFSQSYFSTQSAPPHVQKQAVDYSTYPIVDITSDGQFTNRKVWRTQRPEWFVGKQEPVEGKDYTTVPYSQWKTYQNSPEYSTYTNKGQIASMQQGGMFSGYRMDVPNNIGYTQQSINPNQVYQPTDYSGNFMQNNPLPSYSYNGLQVNPNMVNQNLTSQTNTLSANAGSGYQPDENGNPIQPQFSNIFGGGDNISLGLRTLGAGIGEKDATKIGMGAGLTTISGARNFLGGLSAGRENRRVEEEYRNDLFRDNRTVQMFQEGGEIKNSDILTGKFAIDEKIGTVNIEDGEYIKDNQSGNIQEAIGENHKNGGINVNAQDAKVLSNYTKIGAKNAKELKDRYNISIKKTDTFAKVMDKVNKKIGVDEAIEEQAKAIEDLGKNEVVKDATTKRLNETTLVKEVQEYEQKLESLKGAQNFIFEDIFAMQEAKGKIGNGQLLDAKGKPMEVNETPKMQQGRHIGELANKYGISPQRAEELVKMQEGGQIQTAQEEQIEGQASNPQEEQGEPSPEEVIMAFAEATQQDPNVIMQQLQQLSPEEQQQALIQMVQQLQAPQNEAPQEEMMQEGGEKNTYLQNSTLLNNFTNPPAQLSNLPYTPRETNPNEIWKGENYASFWKPLVEKSMSNPEQAKKIDEWLMSNKDSFAPNIKNQLEGLTGEKRLNRIKQLATDEKPGLFHNALLEAIKVTSPPQEVAKIEAVAATPEFNYGATEEGQTPTVAPDNTSGFQPYITPPSPRQGVILETAQAPNYERIKRTFEPGQAALANQLDTRRQQLIASGLSPMAVESLMANESANAQSSANQNIASVEQFNSQNQQQVNAMQENANFKNDLFNIGQRDTFFLRNTAARDNADISQKTYNDAYNRLGYRNQTDLTNKNLVNATAENYRINNDGTVTYLPPQNTNNIADNTAYFEWYSKQTPQMQEQERIRLAKEKQDKLNLDKKQKALKK